MQLTPIQPGRWLVAVSGGADSVALLRWILAHAPHVTPIVVHLDHESRGRASDDDAAFVRDLSAKLSVPAIVLRRSELAAQSPEPNLEAAWRADRHRFFATAARMQDAIGVLLAHHADDRAETTLLRLLRGGEPSALAGLRRETILAGLRVVRPMLAVRRVEIEHYLTGLGQPWRTDASNASDRFARNRARRFLADRPDLVDPLLTLADAADAARQWIDAAVPTADTDTLDANALADLPDVLARRTARGWLAKRGAPREALSIDVVARLIAMARDRATPTSQDFPGDLSVARRGGSLRVR